MEHKCPTCDREFSGISDYPAVYVAKFQRLDIPPGITFPSRDYEIYVGPKSKCGNPRPPGEVLNFFRDNKNEKEMIFNGATWFLESRYKEPRLGEWKVLIKESIGARMMSLLKISLGGRNNNWGIEREKGEDWEIGYYQNFRKDAKDFISFELNPYFETLECLVGKEIPTEQVLPSFSEPRHGYSRIPNTIYNLTLQELDSERGLQMLKQDNLSIPDLETVQPTRKLAFVITQCGGGSISKIHFLASVGGLAYEGRLKK